ncbi:hypothetical protein MH117_09915 [Paenibacillus sp. ACRRX]|uniref:sigma factor n=1 Tax=Paenibacillus sp. ACRRX TaxID=2918206 RepID=UPI001EF5F4DD|nr:sigma factor [Paenibacillus sp. ACRRX]MCG7407739.1 hypothetical protein [Paenibacillus sp. ACRRX]
MPADFNDAFHAFERRIKYLSARYSRTSRLTYEDYYSHLSECLWNCFKKFDINAGAKFSTYVYKSFNMKIIDLLKSKESKQLSKQAYFDNMVDEDSNAATFEVSDEGAEEHYNQVLYKKKEPDQLVLIEFLLQSPQTDSATTAIVAEFRKCDGNYSEIGRSLGIHHETARRKLIRLSRSYDPFKHGEIIDYFPKGVAIRREYLSA